jgi:hypothetical protein
MGFFVTDLITSFYILLPMHNHYLVKNNLEENHSYTSCEIMPIAVVIHFKFSMQPKDTLLCSKMG